MARSADLLRLGVCGLLGAGLSGCVSTQTEAARVQLNDARIRAGARPTQVTVDGSAVQVQSVALIRSGRGGVFVVMVRNPGRHTVSDLPISVGVHSGRRVLRFLNARSDPITGYFDAHLPAIGPGRTATWVYESARSLPPGARPLVRIGEHPAVDGVAATPAGSLPDVQVTVSGTGSATHASVTVRNRSSVPQYQLPVVLTARRGSRVVAVAGHTIPFLAGDAGTHLSLRLLGRAGAAQIEAQALPTILQ